MSSFIRFARFMRPAATLRPTAPSKPMPSNFFNSSTSRVGPGLHSSTGFGNFPLRRLYSSSNYESTSTTNMRILYGLIGLNCGIFGYAAYMKSQASQGNRKPFVQFMQNFTLNLDDVMKNGRYWQVLTSAFTQVSPMHLAGNMVSIYFMGQMIANTPGIGPARLVTLVIGSALTGSAGYLLHRSEQAKKNGGRDYNRGLGFSGVVMGVGTVAALLYPRAQMAIYGIIPVPLWGLMLGYAAFDGYFLNDSSSRVAHSGHLGGMLFGVVYYFARLRGLGGGYGLL